MIEILTHMSMIIEGNIHQVCKLQNMDVPFDH